MAVKFSNMQFEKSDFKKDMGMTRKRPLVKGSRDGYCATPIFAREVSSHAIKNFADALEDAGQATMQSETLKSNNYEPCHSFASSTNLLKKVIVDSREVNPNEQERVDLFLNMT